jgi:glycosyltransferase involved in cell wall biosynthesis
VASGDDEKMAERIIGLLNEPKRARAMGERGKLIAAEKFSCDRHLQNTLELYDELLSTPKPAPSRIGHEWRLNE